MRSLLSLAALTALTSVAAADPSFTYGNSDDVKDVKETKWTAAAEAGLVFTTGNSETTTASGGIHTSRLSGDNKLAFDGTIVYARSGTRVLNDLNGNGLVDNDNEITTKNSVTAETMASKLRYDRFLTHHNSIFAAALAARDLPAGKEAVLGGQLGYARQVYKTDTAETSLEIGYDYSYEATKGNNLSIHSIRGFIGHKDELTAGSSILASLEALSNLNHENLPTMQNGDAFQDTRVNAQIAISAKIGKSLAVQTSIETHYDHRPAPLKIDNLAPGFIPEASHLDTIMKASLIYTLF